MNNHKDILSGHDGSFSSPCGGDSDFEAYIQSVADEPSEEENESGDEDGYLQLTGINIPISACNPAQEAKRIGVLVNDNILDGLDIERINRIFAKDTEELTDEELGMLVTIVKRSGERGYYHSDSEKPKGLVMSDKTWNIEGRALDALNKAGINLDELWNEEEF
ncbi:MAG: hypothetical protein Q9M91_04865 [Candidatus Dojkabacteria bacterium]|nr:hypothetical protein [Candidatus Dojkabacteria bacterium]MDQ7021140.1 hypothetical protein [Candidatus Dojkabacteria bacterium]